MRRAALVIFTMLSVVSTNGCGTTRGCEEIAPSELPSGKAPGAVTEGVAGGAKALTWGTGRDTVELRLGLSYYAADADRVIARTTVRREPAIVYEIGTGEPSVVVEWGEGCQYSMHLSPELTEEDVVEYAGRF